MPKPVDPEDVERLREQGRIPLCVLFYDMNVNKFGVIPFEDISDEELNALLEKVDLRFVRRA